MNDANCVSLKIYLMEGNTNIEVRRFDIDQSVITSYDYIRERLQMLIPSIRGKVYTILWQDSEGDEITISSDDELMIALTEFKSSIFKIIVRISVADTNETNNYIGLHLPNISGWLGSIGSLVERCPIFAELEQSTDLPCNSCQKIIGENYRYKCLECMQYYQCAECESKLAHPDHLMLRLNKVPSTESLIPRFMHIAKNHFISGTRCAGANIGSFCREKMSHYHQKKEHHEKEKKNKHCGHPRGKRFRGTEQNTSDWSGTGCPMSSGPVDIANLLSAFLGMQRDSEEQKSKDSSAKQSSKSNSSGAASVPTTSSHVQDICCDGPPASATSNMQMDDEPTAPLQTEKGTDDKLEAAIRMLADMGFTNENEWLTHLLEHFNGDITKTLDHLMLGK